MIARCFLCNAEEAYVVVPVNLPAQETQVTFPDPIKNVDLGRAGRELKEAYDDLAQDRTINIKSNKKSKYEKNWSALTGVVSQLIGPAVAFVLLVFALYLPFALFRGIFGGKCIETRDKTGRLMSVKMPKAVLVVLIVTYAVSSLPFLLVLAIAIIDKNMGLTSLPFPLLFVALPICLHMGKEPARLAATLLAFVVCLLFGFLLYSFHEDGASLWAWMCAVLAFLISLMLVGLLNVPQTEQWFRAKNELSHMSNC